MPPRWPTRSRSAGRGQEAPRRWGPDPRCRRHLLGGEHHIAQGVHRVGQRIDPGERCQPARQTSEREHRTGQEDHGEQHQLHHHLESLHLADPAGDDHPEDPNSPRAHRPGFGRRLGGYSVRWQRLLPGQDHRRCNIDGDGTASSFLGRWPLLRQAIGRDRWGLGEAATSARTRALRPRTEQADRVVPSVCPYCAVGCGQLVYFKDGTVTQIEGDPASPISRGRLCPKGSATKELVTRPGRERTVKYRPPHATAWQEIPLEQAMDMIAASSRPDPSPGRKQTMRAVPCAGPWGSPAWAAPRWTSKRTT